MYVLVMTYFIDNKQCIIQNQYDIGVVFNIESYVINLSLKLLPEGPEHTVFA